MQGSTHVRYQMLRLTLLALGTIVALVGFLHIVLGPQADVLLGAQASPESLSDPTLDSQNRFYGAAFLLYAAVFIHCSSDMVRYRTLLSMAMCLIFLGGLARLVSVAVVGWPSHPTIALLVAELVVPVPVLLALRNQQ